MERAATLLAGVVANTTAPGHCNGCLTPLPQVSRCTSTYRHSQQTTANAAFLKFDVRAWVS
jgi:hypothetical protein